LIDRQQLIVGQLVGCSCSPIDRRASYSQRTTNCGQFVAGQQSFLSAGHTDQHNNAVQFRQPDMTF